MHRLFATAYDFYKREALEERTNSLLEQLAREDIPRSEKWELILKCVPCEDVLYRCESAAHSLTHLTQDTLWIAEDSGDLGVHDMESLNDKVRRVLTEGLPACSPRESTVPYWTYLLAK